MGISGPIAPYNNVPPQSQFYQPSQFFISTITLGATTTVTTTVNHNYVVGQLCRLLIPQKSGCFQLNELSGYVQSVPAANQVVLNINSSKNVNAFTTSTAANQPQILAIGDTNSGAANTVSSSTATFIPGSFENISPL